MRFGLALIVVLIQSFAAEAAPVAIKRVIPKGDNVTSARQITITFNQKMAALGKMDRGAEELGITVTPEVKCQWRWLDPSVLSCELGEEEQLKPANKYTITIQPGSLKSQAGTALAKPFTHSFTTSRPAASNSRFEAWAGPGDPHVVVEFNQPVSRTSLEKHLVFKVGGESVRAKVRPPKNMPKWSRYLRRQGAPSFVDLGEEAAEKAGEPDQSSDTAREYWAVMPEKSIGLDQTVSLDLEAGLESAFGPLKGEAANIINFDTFPEFRFLGVRCQSITGQTIEIRVGEMSAGETKCSPLDGAALLFSSPVLKESLKGNLKISPPLVAKGSEQDVWEMIHSYWSLYEPHRKGNAYQVTLPSFLLARRSYRVMGSELRDHFDRKLAAPFDFGFQTDARKPELNVPHAVGVLEKDEISEIPLYVTNLDAVSINYDQLSVKGLKQGLSKSIRPQKVNDISYAVPMEARKMLEGGSSVLTGSFATSPHAEIHAKNNNEFFVQVTPFQVLAKLGHFSSMVWVTDMKTGLPVSDAVVTVHEGTERNLSAMGPALQSVKTDAMGRAMMKGHRELQPKSKQGENSRELVVKVVKDADIALLPFDWDFAVSGYRINSNVYPEKRPQWGHIHTWGTTAQGVYRAGDTIQYKIYVRNQNDQRFVPAPAKSYTLVVRDPTGKEAMTKKDLVLNEFGALQGEFKTTTNAPVGWYTFELKGSFYGEMVWSPLRVLVSDFTPVPFKVETQLGGSFFRDGDQLKVQSSASMHAGGPYASAPVRVTALFRGENFISEHPKTNEFLFDTKDTASDQLFQIEESLDANGRHEHGAKLQNLPHTFGTITVESAVRDDRGKNVASSQSAKYSGLDRRVGLKTTSWVFKKGEPAKVLSIVADEKGAPQAGTAVEIAVEWEETKVAKVKGAGNAYLNQYQRSWVPVHRCKGVSKAEPESCQFVPKEAGSYRLTATIKDTKGKEHSVYLLTYVMGKGHVVWEEGDDYSLPIVPERTDYKVGEKARFLVKNPLPGALALVTVERYGVMRSWTTKLEDSAAVIEVPLEADDVPGFFLSVVLVSPRVKSSEPLGQIDLGKPTFRMGLVQVDVKDPFKEIVVNAKSDKETYRPRDKVKVTIQGAPRNPAKIKEKMEYAVVVLDEAVLSLIQGGTSYFDPYQGFYHLDGLDVMTYNLLTRLVGRQKFEKKGASPGGGGGLGDDVLMRSLFKFVTYWNPSLRPDANGRAQIEFTLPDNLTGWRVLVMAMTPTDRMGLGHSSFKVNKPTELRPVMPNQITEGDRFRAGFSVMNRTDKARKIDVHLEANGAIEASGGVASTKQSVDFKPHERKMVWLDLQSAQIRADRNVVKGVINFKAQAKDALDQDGLVHEVPVLKRRSLETAAAYGTTTENVVKEAIEIPAAIYPDVGSVSVTASPSVIGNVDGAFRYMRDYPYQCWEQKLTKGVMASHYTRLKDYVPDVKWPDSTNLPQATLDLAENYQAPNGGMGFFNGKDEYVSPYLSAYTAVAFQWMRDAGHKVPEGVERKLHGYLKAMLKKKVVPTFYDEGMEATVRALALYALAKGKQVDSSEVKRYFPFMTKMSLFGKAHYLMAAQEAGRSEKESKETMERILSQGNQTSGKFMFNDTWSDAWERILATPIRDNCAVLSAVVKYARTPEGKELVGDVPFRLVRSLNQSKGSRDHFENTQENLFCMQSFIDYAKEFESVPPKFSVVASLDGKEFGKGNFSKVTDPMQVYERPLTSNDPGRKAEVAIDRKGEGRLYYATRVSFAPKEENAQGINAGVDIKREYHVERGGKWELLGDKAEIKRGELVRVEIYLSLPAARNYLVVSDPIPGGLEPVNRDLANTSEVDASKGDFQPAGSSWFFRFRGSWIEFDTSRWSFYHKELRHDSARFYSDYLAPGNYRLSYVAQAIATGQFSASPTLAEEMYDPDVFGKTKPALFSVKE